jgi:hypothetical protein
MCTVLLDSGGYAGRAGVPPAHSVHRFTGLENTIILTEAAFSSWPPHPHAYHGIVAMLSNMETVMPDDGADEGYLRYS